MASNFARANKIAKQLTALGLEIDNESVAGTGTIYLTVSAPSGYETITIRVANHADCYCNSDISADPDGHTDAQVVAFASRWLDRQCVEDEEVANEIAVHMIAAAEIKSLKSHLRKLINTHAKTVGETVLGKDGTPWHSLDFVRKPIYERKRSSDFEAAIEKLTNSIDAAGSLV